MPRGKELSSTKVRKSRFYKCVGKSEREICSFIKSSKSTIHNVRIRKKIQIIIIEKKRSGRKKILTALNNQQIIRLSIRKGLSTREISKSFRKRTLHVTVWKSFKSNSNAKFIKLEKTEVTEASSRKIIEIG